MKTKMLRATYSTGPSKGKVVITRRLRLDAGEVYNLDIVKTMGTKTFAIIFSSTEVIAGLSLKQAMFIGEKILTLCLLPKIDNMREVANSIDLSILKNPAPVTNPFIQGVTSNQSKQHGDCPWSPGSPDFNAWMLGWEKSESFKNTKVA
jgi:hypothetical protein